MKTESCLDANSVVTVKLSSWQLSVFFSDKGTSLELKRTKDTQYMALTYEILGVVICEKFDRVITWFEWNGTPFINLV